MAYRILPVTNILIAFSGGDVGIGEKLKNADEVFVAVIVLGELYLGAEKSVKRDENLRNVEKFREDKTLLPCDKDTAKHYAAIRNSLRIKGRPIPNNDIWIAALAMQHNLTLITRDAHFSEVEGLRSEKW